ncbi:MAG: Lrp/AsnC family transcriptional regulator [Steroidobacteraceae bacterium]
MKKEDNSRNKRAQRSLDELDLRILGALQRDARITNVALAEAVHLSPAPVYRRMQELEASGVIRNYVTLLDPDALGLGVSMFISVSLDKQVDSALRAFEARIADYPEVMECYLMTGESDYLLRVVARDLKSLTALITDRLARIPNVASIRSSLALKQVKYQTALPLDH